MEEMFEDKVLDDLCDVRTDGFERRYLDKYGEPEELTKKEKNEQEIMELIKNLVPAIEKQNKIIDKFNEFKENMVDEIIFWHKPYYKMGFADGIKGKKEIAELKNSTSKIDGTMIENSFIHKYIFQFLREDQQLIKREDYKKVVKKMSAIKEKYPNVQYLLEDRKIVKLTANELKAVCDYIELESDLKDIEIEQVFKLGLKESIIL